jgi:hypothetical protein
VSSISSNKGQIGKRSKVLRSSFSLPPLETEQTPVALSQAASNWVSGTLTAKPRVTSSYNRLDAVRLFNAKLTAQMEGTQELELPSSVMQCNGWMDGWMDGLID